MATKNHLKFIVAAVVSLVPKVSTLSKIISHLRNNLPFLSLTRTQFL